MSAARPDASGMLDWLACLVRAHEGAVPSWQNSAHPGYAYPEAAGLVLTALAQPRPGEAALELGARWLTAQFDEAGRVGRGGLAYTFDSAMALTGLLAARRAGVAVDGAVLGRGMDELFAAIEARRAVDDPEVPARWSTRWSCHELKLAWVLLAWREGPGAGDERLEGALARLAELATLELDGRFLISADERSSYVHASCYALEGLLALRRLGWGDGAELDARLLRGARWLARIQGEDGSLPAWVEAPDELQRRPSDVIAQALRIWAVVDRRAFAEPIARAREALARRQVDGGALAYLEPGEGEPDRNSWATAFASQALRWLEDEGAATREWIV